MACASNVRIYACDTKIPPLYKDDPSKSVKLVGSYSISLRYWFAAVWKFAQMVPDFSALSFPIIGIGGEQFYEVEFHIEVTLDASSELICGVYGGDITHDSKLLSELVRLN